MPIIVDLGEQDRRLARRLRQELDGSPSLKECEDAIRIVKECRHHGIDPESIIGPGMETFLRLEQAECALARAERHR